MAFDRDEVRKAIREKVIELARGLGVDAGAIGDEDIIPATGLLDSAAILELVVWYEATYDFPLAQDEINIDNLGSIRTMTDYLLARKQA